MATLWSIESYAKQHSVYLALERSFSFTQAVMILCVLIVARYYGVELGRNVWGIAIAFGAHISITTVNNALVDLAHPFPAVLASADSLDLPCGGQHVDMGSLGPTRQIQRLMQAGGVGQDSDLSQWQEGWNRTTAKARRVIYP